MIYCVEIKDYPNENQYLEESIYNDENGFEWRVARVNNGMFIKYCGDKYFSESTFDISLDDGHQISIKNTRCIFFNCIDFDTFYEIRNIVKNGFTDEIWDIFQDLFKERFECDLSFLESEII
jgi:hypothetical protein